MNCQSPFQPFPKDFAPTGWGRRSQPKPEPPRRPWWGALIGVLFVLSVSTFAFFAVRGLIR